MGSGVSTNLINLSAQAGNGLSYFITDSSEIENKVIDAINSTILPWLNIKDLKLLDKDRHLVK